MLVFGVWCWGWAFGVGGDQKPSEEEGPRKERNEDEKENEKQNEKGGLDKRSDKEEREKSSKRPTNLDAHVRGKENVERFKATAS